ncbi:MAG: tetratricopeptide repeat protein, partial [Spirochaetes bacterium]|nr:tetratricopeptide repeat protein [Spirochaetota bacterium]
MKYNGVNELVKEAIYQFNRKNLEESEVSFLKVLDIDPTNPEAHYYLGLMYARERNYSKAVLHLKNIVDTGISFLFTQQCHMILGYIYYENREYQRAEAEFLKILKTNLKVVQVYAALAAIYYQLKQPEKALEFAKKAYEMDSYNTNAKNTYGFLLCEYEKDTEKGLELLKEVTRIKPNNPAYLDSLGWAYYKNGDIK